MTTTHQHALNLAKSGYSVIPVRNDGTKRPAISWKTHTTAPATTDQINHWWETNPNLGIGIITGHVSGNLEMLEIEGTAATGQNLKTIADTFKHLGAEHLWTKINTGWVEQSPSGGYHWMYRISDADVPGNTKIAANANHETLAETRGEGGYFIAAPTGGNTHPTGKPWVNIIGGPDTTPTITIDDRHTLHAVLHTVLDQTPTPKPTTSTPAARNMWNTTGGEGDISPGDDYENKTTWDEILTPHGWKISHQTNQTTYWTRPGKKHGISATTGHASDRNRLYVFTSSTSFTPETPYTKFAAYTHLNHNDNYHNAAKQLAQEGYGKTQPRTLTNITPITQNNTTNTTREETTQQATIHNLATKPKPATITTDALTDLGNARAISQAFSHQLTYIPDAGKWANWDGTKWDWAPDNAPAIRAAINTIEAIDTNDDAINKHRTRSLQARSISNAIQLLKALPEMRTPADTFDQNPYELNTPGGTINLKTGKTHPNSPNSYHSMTTTATPKGHSPRWETFINWATQNNQQLATYLQTLVGLTLIGETRAHILPFLYGSGANGKSVFMNVIQKILGDYAIEAEAKLLLKGPDQHPTELANLRGRRLITLAEVNENDQFDEAKLKHLTGGDNISARFMRQDFFTFTPTHNFILAGNHKPAIHSGGNSLWRRLRLIPFQNQIEDKDRNDNLENELLQEADGILNWAVQGAVNYHRNGLQDPDIVTQATREYEAEEDHLGRFVEARLNIGGGAQVRETKRDIRDAYIAWCRTEGAREMNNTVFGRELKARFGLGGTRSNGKHFYTNVTLLADENEPEKEEWWDK